MHESSLICPLEGDIVRSIVLLDLELCYKCSRLAAMGHQPVDWVGSTNIHRHGAKSSVADKNLELFMQQQNGVEQYSQLHVEDVCSSDYIILGCS